MSTILTDILIALARAAIANFLSKELYSVTVPSLFVFSVTVYAALTKDPLRASLPPWIGARGVWWVLRGRKRVRRGRSIVRLSVFGRDVFWAEERVLGELLVSDRVVQVFHKNGIFMEYGANERTAVDKVGFLLNLLIQVLSFENLALFDGVIDEECARFVERVASAKKVGTSLINEFISRTLQRIAYGKKFICKN